MPTTKPALTFFDLPAEIRNAIYFYHLCEDEPIELPYAYTSKQFVEPALLSAHPIVRYEAAPIYYGSNVFETPSPASAQCFLHQLSPECISWIRMFRPLDLILPITAHLRWFDALRTNLNRLVAACGKGALSPDAVCVPFKSEDGNVIWCRLYEIEDFEVVMGNAGAWSLEWRNGPVRG